MLLGSSFGSSIETSARNLQDVMVEVGLIQEVLGVNKYITDVPLRSCWEDIRFVHQALTEFSAVTLPLLNVKLKERDLVRKSASVGARVTTLERRLQGVEVLKRNIESKCISHFIRLNKLDFFVPVVPVNKWEE